MFMDMKGPRSRTLVAALGAAGLGYGIWRMSQGQRDWLSWTLAAIGTAKMVEGVTGWNMVKAARRAVPAGSLNWRPMVGRIMPALRRTWQ